MYLNALHLIKIVQKFCLLVRTIIANKAIIITAAKINYFYL